MKCLKWVRGLSNYILQLAGTLTLPLLFCLVFQDMLFFYKTIHGNYDLNINDFKCLAILLKISEAPISSIFPQ